MRKTVLILFSLFFAMTSSLKAQLNSSDTLFFEAYEDTINIYSDSLFNSNIEKNRKIASFRIIKTLKTALKRQHSFQYSFPNLKAISVIQPEDKAFKIFSWQLIFNNNTYKYFGAIQMNSEELKLMPLIDNSTMMDENKLTTLTTDNKYWLGALYYGVRKVKSGKNAYYTLFGYDGNNALSTKKIIDVLWFQNDEAKFGAPIFDLGEGKKQNRYIIEYKKGISAGSNFSTEHNKIVFDHLIPESKEGEGQYFTYVPDGSYDAFEWKKGNWVYIDKLFDFKLLDGEFPTGN